MIRLISKKQFQSVRPFCFRSLVGNEKHTQKNTQLTFIEVKQTNVSDGGSSVTRDYYKEGKRNKPEKKQAFHNLKKKRRRWE